MRIAIIFPKSSEALFNRNSSQTFGGAEVQMYNIAKEMYNHKDIKTYSLILNYKNINFKDRDKFNLIKTYNENDNILQKAIKLHKVINKINPDVIIQRGLTLESCLLAKYCKVKGIKFVYMFAHDIESEGKYQTSQKRCRLFKMLLNNSYRLIAQNKYQNSRVKEKYFKNPVIIKNGFFIKKQFEKKKKTILWVARSDEWKKPYLFIEIAKKFPKEKFVMICPKSRITTERDYHKLKNNAKKIENLNFLKFVPYNKIDSYFREAKLFVNTSDSEGFPQTFIQATMNSTPIISLNSNPNNFLNKYKCGFCTDSNINLMKTKINMLLRNKNIWRKYSEDAYNYAKENHDIKRNVKEILELIE